MCDYDPRTAFNNQNKSGESQNREVGKTEKLSVKVPPNYGSLPHSTFGVKVEMEGLG